MSQADGSGVALFAFLVASQRYALPLNAVERVLRMVAITPLPEVPDVVVGAINVHGEAVPVVDLARRLGHPSTAHDLDTRLVLARSATRRLAFPVDEAVGIVWVPAPRIVDADTVAPGMQRVSGVATDPDGLLLIGDVDAVLSDEEERRLTAALALGRR